MRKSVLNAGRNCEKEIKYRVGFNMFNLFKKQNRKNDDIGFSEATSKNAVEKCNSNCPCHGQPALPRKCPYCGKIFQPFWGGIDAHYKKHHEAEIGIPYKEWWNLICKQHKAPQRYSAETSTHTPSRTSDHHSKISHDDSRILVDITSSKGFKVGIWEQLDVKIQNVSDDIIKNIEITLFGPVETNGNKIIHILEEKGGQENIVISLKPKEPGNVPLKVEVTFFNKNGKQFKMIEEAFITVAKESENISMQQIPVINIGHIGRSMNIIDNMVQRSNIGVGTRKCPNCGRESEGEQKFCLECGAKL